MELNIRGAIEMSKNENNDNIVVEIRIYTYMYLKAYHFYDLGLK